MTLPMLTEYRQSTLRAMEVCGRRTLHDLQTDPDLSLGWVGQTADLGTMVHLVCAEIMETLRRQGEPSMGTEEAMVIFREVYAASPIVLSAQEHEDAGWMVRGFSALKWRPERVLAIEEALRVDLVCPDGEVRTLKGQPDLVIADPPYGVIVVDVKSGRSKPKAPRIALPEGETIVGTQYLSDNGVFQRQVYGLLVLRRYPNARYATLRELPLRYPGEPPREATLKREELEHVEPRIAAHMMKLALAIEAGERSETWRPRPGSHCTVQCPVAMSCPVPREMRGDGAIDSPERADEVAAIRTVARAQAEQGTKQLKAWQEAGNRPGRPNEHEEVRWGPEPDAWVAKGGGRKFDTWPRVDLVKAESEGS